MNRSARPVTPSTSWTCIARISTRGSPRRTMRTSGADPSPTRSPRCTAEWRTPTGWPSCSRCIGGRWCVGSSGCCGDDTEMPALFPRPFSHHHHLHSMIRFRDQEEQGQGAPGGGLEAGSRARRKGGRRLLLLPPSSSRGGPAARPGCSVVGNRGGRTRADLTSSSANPPGSRWSRALRKLSGPSEGREGTGGVAPPGPRRSLRPPEQVTKSVPSARRTGDRFAARYLRRRGARAGGVKGRPK